MDPAQMGLGVVTRPAPFSDPANIIVRYQYGPRLTVNLSSVQYGPDRRDFSRSIARIHQSQAQPRALIRLTATQYSSSFGGSFFYPAPIRCLYFQQTRTLAPYLKDALAY